MDFGPTIICVVIAVILLAVYCWPKWKRNLPPGPPAIPLFGNSLSIGPQPHVTLLKWKEKYGDTFRFYQGKKLVVVLSNFDTVRRVFGDDNTANRPQGTPIRHDASTGMGRGLIHSQGEIWKTHRRFALSTLRDLGMGKNWLEETILTEVTGICRLLRDTQEKPFNPKAHLTNSISNVICALIFGQRFDLTDPKFTRLTGLVTSFLQSKSVEPLAEALPFLMWFPNPIKAKIIGARESLGTLFGFLNERVTEHEKNISAETQGDAPDYLYAYQEEKEKGIKTSSRSQNTFDDQQLLVSLSDLFIAGTETTSTTTIWAFVYLLENPGVMTKMQEEIDNNVGRKKLLTNSDRGLLPYTEAVILEIQRCASLVPMGVPHMNREEILVDGYTIPKDTILLANLFSIHRDPRYWKNPEAFDPYRFLDDNGRLIRPEGLAPFSIGKRACLGEALAKMELFLFIANLLRSFSLELPSGTTVSHQDYISSIVNCPSPFEIIFKPRYHITD